MAAMVAPAVVAAKVIGAPVAGSAIFEGLGLAASGIGAIVGLGWLWNSIFHHSHKTPKRDAMHHQQAVMFMLHHHADVDMATLQGMNVSAVSDPSNDNATFHYDGGLADGHFYGYSADNQRGLMSGELSFRIPGIDKPITGTWLSVNTSAMSNETKSDFAALAQVLGAFREGIKNDETAQNST